MDICRSNDKRISAIYYMDEYRGERYAILSNKETAMRFFCVLLTLAFALSARPSAGLAGFSIIWSGEQNIALGPIGDPRNWIDIDGNGSADFLFEYFYPPSSPSDFRIKPLVAGNEYIASQAPFSRLYPLPDGTVIGETPPDTMPWDSAWSEQQFVLVSWESFSGLPAGAWVGVDHGLMGIRFLIDDELHYGWMCVSHPFDTADPILHDWAYETQPGVGILAGVVPEPSTWALFLCGGIALLARLRQRRKSV